MRQGPELQITFTVVSVFILPSYLTGGSTLSVYLHFSRYFTNSAPYRLLTLATSQAKVYRFTLQ